MARPQWGAFGLAKQALSAVFVNPRAVDAGLQQRLGTRKAMLATGPCRELTKADMLHNTAAPEIRVDPQTFEVFVDGELATCDPVTEVPLGQRYLLR
jgi:urease subunit alpha